MRILPIAVLCAVFAQSALAGPPIGRPVAPAPTSSRGTLGDDSEDGWFASQIRRFRSFPHLDRAYRLMGEGRNRDALAEIDRYLEIEPRDRAARLSRLMLLFRLEEFGRTIEAANALAAAHPGDLQAILYRALASARLGRTADALTDFLKVASDPAAPPDDRQFALRSGLELLIASRKFPEAQRAIDLFPPSKDDFRLRLERGAVAEALHQWAAADDAYQAALRLAGTDAERLAAMSAGGQFALRRRQWTRAATLLLGANRLSPGDSVLVQGIIEALVQSGQNAQADAWIQTARSLAVSRQEREFLADIAARRHHWPQAVQGYLSLLRESPDRRSRYSLLMRLAQSYEEAGRLPEAEATLREAIALRATPAAAGELATVLEADGKAAEAATEWHRIVAGAPSAAGHVRLSVLYQKLGDVSGAIRELQEAARLEDDPAIHRQLGYLYEKSNSDALAAHEFERLPASELTAQMHLHISDLYGRMGSDAPRLAQLDSALSAGLDPPLRQAAELDRAQLLVRMGEDEAAIAAFRAALSDGLDQEGVHLSLGFALVRLRRWDEAREQFLRADEVAGSPRSLFYLARTYQALGQPSAALAYLKLVAPDAHRLEPAERRSFLDEFGYALDQSGDPRAAADAWREALQLQYNTNVALSLARALLRTGRPEEAEQVLASVSDADPSPDVRVTRLEVLADLRDAQGNFAAERQALAQADAIRPSAERAYRMSRCAQKAGDRVDGVRDLELAVAREPTQMLYVRSLAYAYRDAGRLSDAAPLLARAVAQSPDRIDDYRDLAYLQFELGHREDALATLRAAIDRSTDPSNGQALSAAAGDVPRMREDYANFARVYDLTLYESYRAHAGTRATPTSVGGLIPSQGGAELTYRPVQLPGRNDDALLLSSRILWTNNASGLGVDGASLQGGVGARYKPLQSSDFYLSAERLVRLGANGQNDWLLRASLGLGSDVVPHPGLSSWNDTQFYADAGYFTGSATTALYAEFRQGRTFRVSDTLLFTPHLVVVDHHQNPDPGRFSIFEGGPGVALKAFLAPTRYQPYRLSVDVLLQFRQDFSDAGQKDWVLTTIVKF